MMLFCTPLLIRLLIALAYKLTLQKWTEIRMADAVQPSQVRASPDCNFIDFHYSLYGHTIQKVKNAKYRGVTFDCHLS